MSGSFINRFSSSLDGSAAEVYKISVVSPQNFTVDIETYDTIHSNSRDRLDSQLKLEATAVQNSVLIESFEYKTVGGTTQNRTVRISIERLWIRKIRTWLDKILFRRKEWQMLIGCARFNMPIGNSYVGYGFNTGTLMLYFPVDPSKSLKDNFLEFVKSEIL